MQQKQNSSIFIISSLTLRISSVYKIKAFFHFFCNMFHIHTGTSLYNYIYIYLLSASAIFTSFHHFAVNDPSLSNYITFGMLQVLQDGQQ